MDNDSSERVDSKIGVPVAGFFARAKRTMRQKRQNEPMVFYLYFILRALVLITLVRSAFIGHYEHMMLCVLTLVLLLVPSFLEHTLDIELPDLLESIILLFIFAAEILGEIDAFYISIPFWDTILHTTWGFMCAGIGFALFDILNRSENSSIHLTPLYMAVSAVAFSMCIGACWEIFEYFADCFIGVDMQKDTLVQAINTVWLDPTNSNVTIPVRDIVSSQITLASGEVISIPGGLPRHRYSRHHGRPDREPHRCARVRCAWLRVREDARQQLLCGAFHPARAQARVRGCGQGRFLGGIGCSMINEAIHRTLR